MLIAFHDVLRGLVRRYGIVEALDNVNQGLTLVINVFDPARKLIVIPLDKMAVDCS